jgi:hypothetical protein
VDGVDPHAIYEMYLVLKPRWHSWLRHFVTNRKVAGSIPDGVTGNLH